MFVLFFLCHALRHSSELQISQHDLGIVQNFRFPSMPNYDTCATQYYYVSPCYFLVHATKMLCSHSLTTTPINGRHSKMANRPGQINLVDSIEYHKTETAKMSEYNDEDVTCQYSPGRHVFSLGTLI